MAISYEFPIGSELGLQEHADLASLLAQLAPHRSMLPLHALHDALRASTILLVARESVIGRIVGMATLVYHDIPSGRRGRIEDVVVDERAQGVGIGRELVTQLVARARALDCTTLELTSSAKRVAANRLYFALGFTIKETQVFRLDIQQKEGPPDANA